MTHALELRWVPTLYLAVILTTWTAAPNWVLPGAGLPFSCPALFGVPYGECSKLSCLLGRSCMNWTLDSSSISVMRKYTTMKKVEGSKGSGYFNDSRNGTTDTSPTNQKLATFAPIGWIFNYTEMNFNCNSPCYNIYIVLPPIARLTTLPSTAPSTRLAPPCVEAMALISACAWYLAICLPSDVPEQTDRSVTCNCNS